jgi:hypothetical protein
MTAQNETPQRIRRLDDVRPGDLFLGPIGGLAGVAVRLGQLAVDGGWRVGPLDVRHIGVVTKAGKAGDRTWESGAAPKMVQAMPSGAEEIDLTYDRHWTPRTAFARIPEDYPGQAEDAAAIARAMIDIPYSWASYAALSAYRLGYKAPRLTGWIGRRQAVTTLIQDGMDPLNPDRPVYNPRLGSVWLPVEAICSVLADQAWSLAGKRVMVGTAPQAVTPSQLAQRLLFSMPGVIWGFGADDPLV